MRSKASIPKIQNSLLDWQFCCTIRVYLATELTWKIYSLILSSSSYSLTFGERQRKVQQHNFSLWLVPIPSVKESVSVYELTIFTVSFFMFFPMTLMTKKGGRLDMAAEKDCCSPSPKTPGAHGLSLGGAIVGYAAPKHLRCNLLKPKAIPSLSSSTTVLERVLSDIRPTTRVRWPHYLGD